MPHYRDDHERLLTLVAQQRWGAFNSEDEGLLRAFVYGGFLSAKAVPGHPGKTRLSLTRRGEHYLEELQARELPEPAPLAPCRRAGDTPLPLPRATPFAALPLGKAC
ncbi:hypothetical protein [Pseudomonas sp. NPDC007930]|uniref:hypothetical protein n=1 Tax=Pseudomonas sp. NPDC007930 TaxID=3364417 RepID=UPI0036ECAE62